MVNYLVDQPTSFVGLKAAKKRICIRQKNMVGLLVQLGANSPIEAKVRIYPNGGAYRLFLVMLNLCGCSGLVMNYSEFGLCFDCSNQF